MTKPEGPTEHLTDYRYWRDNYLTSIEVGKEMLAERAATITRLEAERDEANDEITDPWLCGIIRGLEWRASELEAEVATLKEALAECRHALVTATANGSKLRFPRTVEKADAALATPTATAREES